MKLSQQNWCYLAEIKNIILNKQNIEEMISSL